MFKIAVGTSVKLLTVSPAFFRRCQIWFYIFHQGADCSQQHKIKFSQLLVFRSWGVSRMGRKHSRIKDVLELFFPWRTGAGHFGLVLNDIKPYSLCSSLCIEFFTRTLILTKNFRGLTHFCNDTGSKGPHFSLPHNTFFFALSTPVRWIQLSRPESHKAWQQ